MAKTSSTHDLDLANWMGRMPSSFYFRRLDQIILPGTWQSACFLSPERRQALCDLQFITDPSPKWWSRLLTSSKYRCHQHYDLTSQLNNGVRYLDFRVSHYLETRHPLSTSGYYLGLPEWPCWPLLDALRQVVTFLQSHLGEIILIALTIDTTITDRLELLTLIIKEVQSFIHPNHGGRFYANIGYMLQRGDRLVIFCNDAFTSESNYIIQSNYHHYFWPSYLIPRYHDGDYVTDSVKKIELFHEALVRTPLGDSRLYHLAWSMDDSNLNEWWQSFINCQGAVPDIDAMITQPLIIFLQRYERLILNRLHLITAAWIDVKIIRTIIQLNYKVLSHISS